MVAYSFEGMRVQVLFFGLLKESFGRESEWMEVAAGARVKDLLKSLESRDVSVEVWDSIAVAVNREYAQAEDVLRDGDEVALLPPVSGGAW